MLWCPYPLESTEVYGYERFNCTLWIHFQWFYQFSTSIFQSSICWILLDKLSMHYDFYLKWCYPTGYSNLAIYSKCQMQNLMLPYSQYMGTFLHLVNGWIFDGTGGVCASVMNSGVIPQGYQVHILQPLVVVYNGRCPWYCGQTTWWVMISLHLWVQSSQLSWQAWYIGRLLFIGLLMATCSLSMASRPTWIILQQLSLICLKTLPTLGYPSKVCDDHRIENLLVAGTMEQLEVQGIGQGWGMCVTLDLYLFLTHQLHILRNVHQGPLYPVFLEPQPQELQ